MLAAACLHVAELHAAPCEVVYFCHRFEPCGYSMNGMDGAQASTIHITPELGFSYASVEVFCQVCECIWAAAHRLRMLGSTCSLGSVISHINSPQ